MACGCSKRRAAVTAPPTADAVVAAARQASSVGMYDVYNGDGALVASYTNPVTARAEARRSKGTVAPIRFGGSAALTLPAASAAGESAVSAAGTE